MRHPPTTRMSKIKMLLRLSALLTLLLAFPTIRGQSHQTEKLDRQEQRHFSVEQDFPHLAIKNPVNVPPAVLEILRTDERVQKCVKDGALSPDQVVDTWFVGSEVHLGASDGHGLVVLPRLPQKSSPERHCLFGANIDPFWVFENTSQGYKLVLAVAAHDLVILKNQSRGRRKIEAISMTATTIESTDYCYTDLHYEPCGHSISPIR